RSEEGTTITCDFPDCKMEWFHLSCLQLNSVAKGKWYWPVCHKK
uniref:Zinc finger PHD-type domain-containing protein n=1 Tax=Amphimedon queenslandica TaxID=400682 RepID=A0A1X7VGX8_AMPQE